MKFLVESMMLNYYVHRKKHGVCASLKEMLVSPILLILECHTADYPNGKRWWIQIGVAN